MASLLSARDLSKTYGTHTLFSGIAIGLETGDRLGLIGPNGAGKSTLLKILAGLEQPDTGDLGRRRQLSLAYVPQQDQFDPQMTARQIVVDVVLQDGRPHDLDPDTRAAITLSRLGFEQLDRPVGTLSGGWRKRLNIARAVALEPDAIFLDEPTNHLDLEGVLWLEQFVRDCSSAVVFITHDRTFLDRIATRIIELSRAYPDGTFEVKGNYTEFVRRKEAFLDAQATQQTALAGKVRRDTAWLRQGIQGRQTRNKSQVQDASRRQDELASLRDRNNAPTQKASFAFQATERKTHKLLAATGLSKALGDKPLFQNLDLTLSPGTRLGLLGPNGSGKTTLMRLLTEDLAPDTGTLRRADQLKIVNFTQHREALDPTQPLREALCPIGDTVHYRGQSIHVAAWAKRFLFDASQFNHSVGDLSGGEQARIFIANLMLQSADVLILDEPTNDLDIPSLEVLEEALMSFPGAIVLVTHDRFLLQRLSTELLALDGQGGARSFPSYEQWEQAARTAASAPTRSSASAAAASTERPTHPPVSASSPAPAKAKLSYKLQRELDGMEAAILAAEAQVEALQTRTSDPALLADHRAYAEACAELGHAQTRVETLYARWAELEAMA